MPLFWLGLLGLLVGASSVFLGLGGGLFIVPLLNLFFLEVPREAVGTSVATVFLVVSVNSWRFHVRKLVDWRVVMVLGPIASVSAFLAARLTHLVPGLFLELALATLLLSLGFYIVLKRNPKLASEKSPPSPLRLALMGILAGAASGFTGIGSGLIITPLLLKWNLVSPERASPTSNGVMVFTTLAAAVAFLWGPLTAWQVGAVHLDAVLAIFLGAQVFAVWGRREQEKLSKKWRERLLIWIMFVLAAATIWAAFKL